MEQLQSPGSATGIHRPDPSGEFAQWQRDRNPSAQTKSAGSPPGAGQHTRLALPAAFYRGLSLLLTSELLAAGSEAQRGHQQVHPLLQSSGFAPVQRLLLHLAGIHHDLIAGVSQRSSCGL